MVAPVVFRSTSSGAPTLSGTAGDLINVLSHCLVIGAVYSTANDSSFNDNTTEARLNGGTTFTLFPTPATTDRTYFGSSSTFANLTFDFGTVGTTATYVWEYWNGSAWTTLTVTDGTTNFTANGSVTFTIPGSWATTSVNSVTMYWVRVRYTGSAPSTNPLVNSVTALGWLEYYSATNIRAYRQGTGSNQVYLRVNDSATATGADESAGSPTAKEARIRGYNAMTGVSTGTGPFPTVAQKASGHFPRKSTTADATTRAWVLIGDHLTFYTGVLTGDTASVYHAWVFGDFYSLKTNDTTRSIISCRATTESSGTGSEEVLDLLVPVSAINATTYTSGSTSGDLGGTTAGKMGDLSLTAWAGGSNSQALNGITAYKNPADTTIYISPVKVITNTGGNTVRGRMRGFWHFCHAIANVSDADTLTGSGDLAGKSFVIIKQTGNTGVYCIETSNTWETN